MGPTEWTVMVLVVGMRLALPLTIPYFPLPGVLACLILDAADQTIFQQFPGIELDRYQSYDKALDIYYLAITYLATMRNWTNRPAFRMSQFLYYYRLVGVVAFEISQLRLLLLIFPNTFEYFFIFYEAVRLRWNTARLGKWAVVIATVMIWVFIKLPQEWWIHIAKLDVTEAAKQHVFGVSADASWGEAVTASPMGLVAIIAGIAVIVGAAWWMVARFAPPGITRSGSRPIPCRSNCADRSSTAPPGRQAGSSTVLFSKRSCSPDSSASSSRRCSSWAQGTSGSALLPCSSS